MLSIAITTGSASRSAGGLFNSVRRLAQSLATEGHHVSVFALRDRHTEEDLPAWGPLKPIIIDTVGPGRLGFAPTLSKALGSPRFDVIHQHGIWQAFSATVSKVARRTATPTMISPRGMLDPWALQYGSWKKRLSGLLYESANLSRSSCLHALNTSEATAIRSHGLTNPIAVIPNGADLPNEAWSPTPPKWWPGGRVLLFIGRIHPKKGIMDLIEAYASLVVRAPEIGDMWRLVIAGWDDGGHEGEVKAKVARYNLLDRIILCGPLFGDEKEAALSNAEAFILPSYSEGLPMAVLEAWAWRLPVLMTEACNLPDGFATGAAVRIDANPTTLATALVQTLVRPSADLAAIGARGRQHVTAHYSWPRIANAHATAYRWMAEGCRADSRPDFIL